MGVLPSSPTLKVTDLFSKQNPAQALTRLDPSWRR